jgi:hypothetical protein
MPVAFARKVEFWIRTKYPDLDFQVRPIMLTKQQCVDFSLPRKPIKKSERRLEAWHERHGEGATELDALESLHPGEFARILVEEIERYYDDTLQERIDEVESEVDEQLDEINAEARADHETEIRKFRARHAKIVKDLRARIEALNKDFRKQFEGLSKDMKPRWGIIADSLGGRFDFDSVDWPEPNEGDDDDDPLFDSTRDYVEQIDRFKQHQGRPTTRKSGSGKQVNSRRKLSRLERERRSAAWRSGRRT